MLSQINWSAIAVFWAIFMSVVQFGTAVVVILLKKQAQDFQRQAATAEAMEGMIEGSAKGLRENFERVLSRVQIEIEKLESADKNMDRRVIVLEQSLAHAPKARDLEGLRHEITNLRSDVSRFEGRQDENNRVLRLLHEYLMEKGR